MAMDRLLGLLIESLPRSFPFYHLGEVQLAEGVPISTDRIAVAYTLSGDVRGALILVLEEGLDVSTYSELGNIIASRMATHFEHQEGWDVSISPPRILTQKQFKALIEDGHALNRVYLHQQPSGKRPVTIQALVLSQRTIGHA